MWISRDFDAAAIAGGALPIKVLKGPRQVGKTSVLERLGTHRVVYLDDAAVRTRANDNPRLFLDGLPARVVLDEAALAPELFPELKRRVDEDRRVRRAGGRPVREPVEESGRLSQCPDRHLLEANGIVRRLPPFATNLNSRLIKAPKFFVEDVALAGRLQGWTEPQPLLLAPVCGALLETLAVGEVARYFINRGIPPRLSHLRSKEKVEIDLLVHLSDDRTLAIEVKSTPAELDGRQLRLLDTLGLTIVERWVATPTPAPDLATARVVPFDRLWAELDRLEPA